MYQDWMMVSAERRRGLPPVASRSVQLGRLEVQVVQHETSSNVPVLDALVFS